MKILSASISKQQSTRWLIDRQPIIDSLWIRDYVRQWLYQKMLNSFICHVLSIVMNHYSWSNDSILHYGDNS